MNIDEAILHAEKVVEDKRADADWKWRHGRLNADDCISCAEEHEQLAKWLKELKCYKDAEEQGLLLRLPCKVGDTVYHTVIPPGKLEVLPFEVRKIKILISENGSCAIDLVHDSCSSLRGDIFGERVFLSKEEAEQSLKKFESEGKSDE